MNGLSMQSLKRRVKVEHVQHCSWIAIWNDYHKVSGGCCVSVRYWKILYHEADEVTAGLGIGQGPLTIVIGVQVFDVFWLQTKIDYSSPCCACLGTVSKRSMPG